MVIDISPDGTTQAMHRDEFDLAFLGDRQIERATEIKFNEATQLWDICLPMHKLEAGGLSKIVAWSALDNCSGFATYDGARKVEVKWLDECRLSEVTPQSLAGLRTLKFVRHIMGL